MIIISPPFDEMVVLINQEKGLEGDAVYEAIIESSSRTSAEYNARFGIKQESKQ